MRILQNPELMPIRAHFKRGSIYGDIPTMFSTSFCSSKMSCLFSSNADHCQTQFMVSGEKFTYIQTVKLRSLHILRRWSQAVITYFNINTPSVLLEYMHAILTDI